MHSAERILFKREPHASHDFEYVLCSIGRPFELELNDKIAAEGLQYDAYVQC